MYRTEEKPRHEHRGRAIDHSTSTDIILDNGVVSRIAFPCYYAYYKDGIPIHKVPRVGNIVDHFGWPEPKRIDRSCQPIGLQVEPINLRSEGYNSVKLVLPDGVSDWLFVSSVIEDNVIRLIIRVQCPDAIEEQVEVPYSLYVTGTYSYTTDYAAVPIAASDLVTKGVIRILPARLYSE